MDFWVKWKRAMSKVPKTIRDLAERFDRNIESDRNPGYSETIIASGILPEAQNLWASQPLLNLALLMVQ